jgi:uncharacterized membrane protein YphA (DoxX/SURF4 family)
LQGLFSTFPGGRRGLGLLLVRAMVGCTLLIQGLADLSNPQAAFHSWILAAVAVLCAIFLLFGLFTPIVSLLVAVGVVGMTLPWFSAQAKNLLSNNILTINTVISSLAILLLGPGAFSVDARLFGRREIIIPQIPKSRDS